MRMAPGESRKLKKARARNTIARGQRALAKLEAEDEEEKEFSDESF